MKVVVTGATGNVGTSLLARLADDPSIRSIVGVARRRPTNSMSKVEWVAADVATSDLSDIVVGADAVVHLAWLIQPSHDVRSMWATNVVGTSRVARAVTDHRVPAFVVASSVGAYSPAPAGVVVDEGWPTDGVPESSYSWQKAHVERMLDVLAERYPASRVVRVRPALIFKRESARHVRNLFLGRLAPTSIIRPDGLARLLQRSPLPFQVVHADDVAAALHQSLLMEVSGPFNLAAAPSLGRSSKLAQPLVRAARVAVGALWRARAIPVDPGWLSLAESAPLMSTNRAQAELGWQPANDSDAVLRELLAGLRDDASYPTPPLEERHLFRDDARQPAVDPEPVRPGPAR